MIKVHNIPRLKALNEPIFFDIIDKKRNKCYTIYSSNKI